MCDFKVWFQPDEDVYVLQCVECNTFQVRWHNAAFMFDPFAYKAFRDAVYQQYDAIELSGQEDQILIPTFTNGMDLLLSADSLKDLYILIDVADTEMKAAQIASLFN